MQLENPEQMAELFVMFHKELALLYPDSELNEAGNNAVFLEENGQEIAASGKYSTEEILYGRYYWYTKFLRRYEALYGMNAGMEQAQFQIIEAMDWEGCVDCGRLEAIEARVGEKKG